MHIIAPYQKTVSVFNRQGLVRRYGSMLEALDHLGYKWISANVVTHLIAPAQRTLGYLQGLLGGNRLERTEAQGEFIMRDEAGEPIVYENFQALRKARGRTGYGWGFGYWNGEGPVPLTGKRGAYRCYRRPHTQALRRMAAHFAEEDEPPVRASRNAAMLPNAWDDNNRSDVEDRSWKRHRLHQRKASGEPRAG